MKNIDIFIHEKLKISKNTKSKDNIEIDINVVVPERYLNSIIKYAETLEIIPYMITNEIFNRYGNPVINKNGLYLLFSNDKNNVTRKQPYIYFGWESVSIGLGKLYAHVEFPVLPTPFYNLKTKSSLNFEDVFNELNEIISKYKFYDVVNEYLTKI